MGILAARAGQRVGLRGHVSVLIPEVTQVLAGLPSADLSGYSGVGASGIAVPCDKDLQRSEGLARLVLAGSAQGTRIVDIFQRSPIRIMFPGIRAAPVEEAVVVNTGGGIAGGDRLEFAVTALPSASVAVTSQAAERVYRALNEPALIETRLKVCNTAKLAWLPQETIVFSGGRMRRNTEIEISAGAELLALESLVLGRAAHGEEIVDGEITDGWQVRLDGRLIWADRFRATDDVFPRLRSRALLADFKAIGTLIYFGPDPAAQVQLLRDLAPLPQCQCFTTAVSGLVIARLGARAAVELKAGLREILLQFERTRVQGPFRVPKMWSC
jgi:urease accessory protein